jgi:2-hydroxychromene-2-carboxylate isomerase
VCETLFAHVWVGGLDAADAMRLQEVTALLAPLRDPKSEAVKQELNANGQAAIAQGVFGVPAFEVDGKVFWGLDALPMLRDYIENGAWFVGARWDAADKVDSAFPL